MTKGVTTAVLATALSIGAASAYGQTTGSQSIGTSKGTKQSMKDAENGWSAKKNIMDKAVYNDNNEKIGNSDNHRQKPGINPR